MVKCDVIQDLIPLYYDEVASEGSRDLVDEHVKDCTACAEVLAKLNESSKAEILGDGNVEIGALKKMKRRIHRKIAVITIAAASCTAILIWMMFTWMIPIPFSDENIVVHPANTIQPLNSIRPSYDMGEPLNSSPLLDILNNNFSVSVMQINDEFFIRSSDTFYTRFLSRGSSGRWYSWGDPLSLSVTFYSIIDDNSHRYEIGDEINRIYYMYANYNRLFALASDPGAHAEAEAALERAKRNAILVWER